MYVIDKQYFKIFNSLLKLENKYNGYNIKDMRTYLKSSVIDSDNLKDFDSINNSMFRNGFVGNKYLDDFLIDSLGIINYCTCYRFKESYYHKTIRLKKRINRLFKYDNLFFVTFTFDDKKLRKKDLSKYTTKYLRGLVTKWLKTYSIDYVGNIDFGGQKGRLHFHCVIASTLTRIDRKSWKYGALNIKRIVNKDSTKLSLYVNKLCSHALKESTKNQYLIYPKKILDNFP